MSTAVLTAVAWPYGKWSTAHRTRVGFRRGVRRLRPLPPDGRQPGAHGVRHRRATRSAEVDAPLASGESVVSIQLPSKAAGAQPLGQRTQLADDAHEPGDAPLPLTGT